MINDRPFYMFVYFPYFLGDWMLTLRTEVCYQERPQEPYKTGRNQLVLFFTPSAWTTAMNCAWIFFLCTDYYFTRYIVKLVLKLL